MSADRGRRSAAKSMELEFRLNNLENALNEMTNPPSDPRDDETLYGSRARSGFTGLFIAEDTRQSPQCPLKVMKILHGNMETFHRVMDDMHSVVDQVVSKFTEIRDKITSLGRYRPAKILDLVTPLLSPVRLAHLHLSCQKSNVWMLKDAFVYLTSVIEAQPKLAWEGDAAEAAKEYGHIMDELQHFLTIEAAERIAWESSHLEGKRLHMKEYTKKAIEACERDVLSALLILRKLP
jgi:hypothetical protein